MQPLFLNMKSPDLTRDDEVRGSSRSRIGEHEADFWVRWVLSTALVGEFGEGVGLVELASEGCGVKWILAEMLEEGVIDDGG